MLQFGLNCVSIHVELHDNLNLIASEFSMNFKRACVKPQNV